MEFIKQTKLSETDKREIFDLWNNEYPKKLNYKLFEEFEKYLENLKNQSHILMRNENQNIKGWYFDFIREKERWFVIILDSKLHGQGIGTKILNIAKKKETELNGWVIDHNNYKKKNEELYASPLNFYLKNRFENISEKRLEIEKISAEKIKWKK